MIRANAHRFGATRTLVLVGLLGIGLVATRGCHLRPQGSNSWTTTGSLNTARTGHTATLLPNGEVLVAGGANAAGFLPSAELYNQATGKWTVSGSMTNTRGNHTATLLPNGKVLVAGGVSNGAAPRAASL